jgi:hypothetical protein
MIAQLRRTSPAQISGLALIGGFLLMVSGYRALQIVGAGLILLAFLAPFIQTSLERNRRKPMGSANRRAVRANRSLPDPEADPSRNK